LIWERFGLLLRLCTAAAGPWSPCEVEERVGVDAACRGYQPGWSTNK